jgi:hypothetical protein
MLKRALEKLCRVSGIIYSCAANVQREVRAAAKLHPSAPKPTVVLKSPARGLKLPHRVTIAQFRPVSATQSWGKASQTAAHTSLADFSSQPVESAPPPRISLPDADQKPIPPPLLCRPSLPIVADKRLCDMP